MKLFSELNQSSLFVDMERFFHTVPSVTSDSCDAYLHVCQQEIAATLTTEATELLCLAISEIFRMFVILCHNKNTQSLRVPLSETVALALFISWKIIVWSSVTKASWISSTFLSARL